MTSKAALRGFVTGCRGPASAPRKEAVSASPAPDHSANGRGLAMIGRHWLVAARVAPADWMCCRPQLQASAGDGS